MFIIAIAGGSGSGKSTLARELVQTLGEDITAHFSMDCYYHSTAPAHLIENGFRNQDHPDAFDWDLLHQDILKLKSGRAIEMPIFDFGVGRRLETAKSFSPKPVVIFEGLYPLWDSRLRSLFDYTIFIEVPEDVRLDRRVIRDGIERQKSPESVIKRFELTVKPMHDQFLEPTKEFAHLRAQFDFVPVIDRVSEILKNGRPGLVFNRTNYRTNFNGLNSQVQFA